MKYKCFRFHFVPVLKIYLNERRVNNGKKKEKLRKKGKSTLHNAQQYKHLAENENSRKVTNENL